MPTPIDLSAEAQERAGQRLTDLLAIPGHEDNYFAFRLVVETFEEFWRCKRAGRLFAIGAVLADVLRAGGYVELSQKVQDHSDEITRICHGQ